MDVYTFGSTSADATVTTTTTPHSTSTAITSCTPTSTSGESRKSQLLPIKKVLTLSHVDTNHPFLPLTRKQVEDRILVHWTPQQRELLRNDEEVNLNARKVNTNEIYVMKLRWRGNYYNFIGKWGKIVRRKGLRAVEDHILLYWAYQHQIIVNARDDDTGDVFLMKLKWRRSYYNLIGKWGQIIRGKTLEVGQEIRVRWDNGYLVFSVA
ncbi:B3 DNA binding domain-containing protein [Tanacetum coccineum]